ncbi:HalOD1 output domain-containing protein [Halorussus amylolyticus]|uniref:HalOD1 output domain-containing protein n=1 Tax=Halorussus amylolyticus TaxID=1126242 RepID=UPI001050FFC7|nr:HalOD1 output domain-containing protein [Halorussus amylolyticus]
MVASRQPTDAHTKSVTYRADPDETPSEAVVAAVASASDCRPTAAGADGTARVLPPLYDAIDPDALDALFAGGVRSPDRPRATAGKVEFVYHGHRVTAHSDGSVVVEPR